MSRYTIEQADAGGTIWRVVDPDGNHVGSCSSRHEALRIAALANGPVKRQEPPTTCPSDTVAGGERRAVRVPAGSTQMFDWYVSAGAGSRRTVLRKCSEFLSKLLQKER